MRRAIDHAVSRKLDCFASPRNDVERGADVYITTGASGSSFGPARCAGKCVASSPRHRLDPLDHAALEISGPETRVSISTQIFSQPACADLGVDAAVGDDLDVAVGQQQIDQHAVVVRGVPDPQLREDIQRPLPRRLIAKQRRAVERAFDHEAHLAGMRGLARLDRLLDRRQRLRRKNAPQPPAVFEQMPADALDAHVYQLPDAPPPPKLPPPPLKPPLLLELPPLDHEPPLLPPDQPPLLPRRPGPADVNPSLISTNSEREHAGDHRREQRADQEPGDQGRQRRRRPPSRAAGPAGCATARRKIRRNDQERIEQVRSGLNELRILPMRRLRRRQLLAVDDPDHPVDARRDAAGEIAALEFRRDVLVDDALGGGVGQRAFEAVADLDAQAAVVLGDDEQRAVVDLLAADLPGFRDPERELLDRLGVRRRHDQHRDLAALARLQILQRLRQRGDVAGRERAGLIDHPPVSGGTATSGQRRTSPAQQQRKKGGSCSVHRRSSVHARYFAGAGVGLKSTFGAVEIAFSFSTVKFGFSL